MDWKRYDVKDFEEEPIAVLVNLISVHVPYTGAGKQAISQEEDVMDEIKFALMEASRGVQKYLSGKRKAHEIANKKKVVSRYIQQLSGDLSSLSGEKRADIEKALTKIIEEKYAREETEVEEAAESEPAVKEPETGGEEE